MVFDSIIHAACTTNINAWIHGNSLYTCISNSINKTFLPITDVPVLIKCIFCITTWQQPCWKGCRVSFGLFLLCFHRLKYVVIKGKLFAISKLNRKLRKMKPQTGIEPTTFWSSVRRSNRWATRPQLAERRLRCVLFRTCDILTANTAV